MKHVERSRVINSVKTKENYKAMLCKDLVFKSIFSEYEDILAKMIKDIIGDLFKGRKIRLETNELPISKENEKSKRCDFIVKKENIFATNYLKCDIILCRKGQIKVNNEERILNQMKQNSGIITTNEVEQMRIARKTLTRMVEKGIIERETQGLYVLPNSWGDEYYNLIFSTKGAVFSHATALYLHGLSERVPLMYEISVINGYNASLKTRKNVRLYFVSKDIFELGKIEIQSPQGKNVPVYDVERCLCDILKNKESQDIEIIKYAYKNYVKSPKKNIYKLMEYAKKLKVEEEVNSYLEVLL